MRSEELGVVHIVPGVGDVANGMAVVARLLAKEQGDAEVVDLKDSLRLCASALKTTPEVWVHGMWLPKEWLVCWHAIKAGKRLVRMTHGSLSPLYLRHQSPFKKWLVGPIERWCLRRCDRIVATCDAEKGWIGSYLGRRCPPIELTNIKRFFNLNPVNPVNPVKKNLHLLYLGRRHPLKGVEYLEEAVRQLNSNPVNPVNPVQNSSARSTCHTYPKNSVSSASQRLCVRFVSNAFGEELEKVWDWCDVLVLPTLSDNFGLVIAEALERGKRVITTDGAPAWGDGNSYGGRLVYLEGYRDGSPEERVRLLMKAIEELACRS